MPRQLPTEPTTPPDTPVVPTDKPKRKTYTRWDAFQVLNLVPVEIRCEGYHAYHPTDLSCHTRLPLQAQSMIDHYMSEHGGGFSVKVRIADKPWAGWQELQDKGMELDDFRCAECLNPVRVNPADIQFHMKPHMAGKRMKSSDTFLMTISAKGKAKDLSFDFDET